MSEQILTLNNAEITKAIASATVRMQARLLRLDDLSIYLGCGKIYAKHIAEKVVLNFGVKPIITDIYKSTDKMIENARKMAVNEFELKKGDLIIITGGFPIGEARRTNYLRIMEI